MAETPIRLALDEARALAVDVLTAARTSAANARATADALVAAEADGLGGHGLSRLPAYADQALSGKVDGEAVPVVEADGAVVRVDAAHGFAFPAIAAGFAAAEPVVAVSGLAAVAVRRSHHAGALGGVIEPLAGQGLAVLAFTNSPAAIAPWGGARGLFGTNPIAFACPRDGVPPLVVDASLSKVARGKVMVAAQKGEPIPEGWALDAEGRPTTDPKAALKGTMLPVGDAKGAALVLMVEIIAAALTGGQFGFEASSFFDAKGPPPAIGQFFLLIDPVRTGGPDFPARLETLLGTVLAEEGVRLPGSKRLAARRLAAERGIEVSAKLFAELKRRVG